VTRWIRSATGNLRRAGTLAAALMIVAGGCVAGAGGSAAAPAPAAMPTADSHAVHGSAAPASAVPVGYVKRIGPDQGKLTTEPGGIVLLTAPAAGEHSRATTPIQGNRRWTWHSAQPLPAQGGHRHVDVFYTPHPDDETLSMAVLITAAIRRGDRVLVVGLTDGRTTGAIRAINAELAAEHRHTATVAAASGAVSQRVNIPARLSQDQIGVARDAELRRAVTDLGLSPKDLVLAHLDAPGSDRGALVTVSEAAQVIRTFAARYPGATHVTMSDIAEHQQDHLDAGVALHQLLAAGTVTSARWTVSRLWWRLPSPAGTWALPTPSDRDRIRRAAQEYLTWDPAAGKYAVGFYSVRWQFAALARDVRDRVHATGPKPRGDHPTPRPT